MIDDRDDATFRYVSQNVGSRKYTTVSGGIALASMPQRRTCRQSTCNAVGVIAGKRSERGRRAGEQCVHDLRRLPPHRLRSSGMRPPTTPVPMNVSNGPYTGAFAAAAISAGGIARIEHPAVAVLDNSRA